MLFHGRTEPDPMLYNTGEIALTTWSVHTGGKQGDETTQEQAEKQYKDAVQRGERPMLTRTDLVKQEYTDRGRQWMRRRTATYPKS